MSKNPRKNIDYRALWEHPELMIKAPALRVMVRAAARERFLKAQNDPTLLDISCTHKSELIKVPDGQEKIALIGQIPQESLSFRSLKARLSLGNTRSFRCLRSRSPVKAISGLGKALERHLLPDIGIDTDKLARLGEERKAHVYRFIRQTRARTVVAQRWNAPATASFPRQPRLLSFVSLAAVSLPPHRTCLHVVIPAKRGNPGKVTVHGERVSGNGKEPGRHDG